MKKSIYVKLTILFLLLRIFDGAWAQSKQVSDGSRYRLVKKGFSIRIPKGWEFFDNQDSLSLLLQAPFLPGDEYQRSIQVNVFTGGRYIDEITKNEFEEVIIRKIGDLSSTISNLRVERSLITVVADGRPAVLYYISFNLDGQRMMQAHLLLSSSDFHYLVSYTDLEKFYRDQVSLSRLQQAWSSITSIQLDSETPRRFGLLVVFSIFLVMMSVLMSCYYILRKSRESRRLRDYASSTDVSYGVDDLGDGYDGVSKITGPLAQEKFSVDIDDIIKSRSTQRPPQVGGRQKPSNAQATMQEQHFYGKGRKASSSRSSRRNAKSNQGMIDGELDEDGYLSNEGRTKASAAPSMSTMITSEEGISDYLPVEEEYKTSYEEGAPRNKEDYFEKISHNVDESFEDEYDEEDDSKKYNRTKIWD